MNNQFNTTNITQHGIQMSQHVTNSPPRTSVDILSTLLSAQQQQQQLAAVVAAGAIYSDPRQLHLNSNSLENNFYTTSGTAGTMGTTQRFYTSAGTAATALSTSPTVTATTTHHPNTILITNNYSQGGQSQNSDQRNIRLVTHTSNPLNPTNSANLATTPSGFAHSQHVYNLNSNKPLQQLFPEHLIGQASFQSSTADLLHQHFTPHAYVSSQQQRAKHNHAATSEIQVPHYYVSPENPVTSSLTSNQKIITNVTSNNGPSSSGNASSSPLMPTCANTSNPTVVLDRINICINNLYTDTSSSSASNSLASTPAQQPSPIIPAIQHKPVIENALALPIADNYESNVLVIDEPDSTTTATTPHTPPATPENATTSSRGNSRNNNAISTTSATNSPTTSYNYTKYESSNDTTCNQNFNILCAQNIEVASQAISDLDRSSIASTTTRTAAIISKSNNSPTQPQYSHHNITTSSTMPNNTVLTPPTPPSPETFNNKGEYLDGSEQIPLIASAPLFANGEDVFIKRHDDRFYLGTVIDTARNQFLVRFDDKTEVWCEAEEMRKLGVSSDGDTLSSDRKSVAHPMCVACKRTKLDCKVEICERCARGWHRKCTSETSPGSNIWLCKRCAKPMKLDESLKFSSEEEETETETCLELFYNFESLTWDDKHRTNVEQMYCYCGKSGKFDYNMLQCWRCFNWYHTHCIHKFIGPILKGDCFFVFCCSVCNEGDEYLRRIQASWADIVHLILYNLSAIKTNHKYHHLLKDIIPFILEKRKILPIPKEWISMQEKEFSNKIKATLIGNSKLFACGKEIKRDANSFALRIMEPPEITKFSVKHQDIFNDDFVCSNLNAPLLIGAQENLNLKFLTSYSTNLKSISQTKRKLDEAFSSHDVYEFDDTSDDEIPIKHILDKVKKTKVSPLSKAAHDVETTTAICVNMSAATMLEKMDVEDDNANDALITLSPQLETCALSTTKCQEDKCPKKEVKDVDPVKCNSIVIEKYTEENLKLNDKHGNLNTTQAEKRSHKRKAFTFSKSYNTVHLIDSSSDENSSSSSRGTSLDLIIPPPKNFLGQNNPFRIISPKKNISDINVSKKSVSFGIFNTTALNFSSKLAAFKGVGLFPKISSSNLVKATGHPRTVRTIKRRLSAKDITIGPNKEVRRRRTRRLSSSIEVISTTTINPIPKNYFPIQAKDLLAAAASSTTTAASLFNTQTNKPITLTSSLNTNHITSTSASSSPVTDSVNVDTANANSTISQPSHGRCLRQRPQKSSPNTSRRSSVSSNQSTTSSVSATGAAHVSQTSNQPHEDLKQSVNKYFGIVNRIESGEQFFIRAKRQLADGQMQYLIEWGETNLNLCESKITN